MQLAGKAALVTGAAGGLGRAVAEAYAREGARLLLTDRDLAGLQQARTAIGEAAHLRPGNLAEATDIEALAAAADEDLGGLDILVNCAGLGLQRPLLEHTPEDFRRLLEINLIAGFALSRRVAEGMIARGRGGRIVNLASIAGLRGSAGRAAYGASKAALINLTQVMAVELAPHRITANAIAPGPVETEMAKAMHTRKTRAAWAQTIPLRRYGEPAEIAAAAVYLASDAAAYTSGQVIAVDGGFAGAGLIFDPR